MREWNMRPKKRNPSLTSSVIKPRNASNDRALLGTNGDMGCQDGTTGSLLRRIFCQLSRAFFILSRGETGLISDSISTRGGPEGIVAWHSGSCRGAGAA